MRPGRTSRLVSEELTRNFLFLGAGSSTGSRDGEKRGRRVMGVRGPGSQELGGVSLYLVHDIGSRADDAPRLLVCPALFGIEAHVGPLGRLTVVI